MGCCYSDNVGCCYSDMRGAVTLTCGVLLLRHAGCCYSDIWCAVTPTCGVLLLWHVGCCYSDMWGAVTPTCGVLLLRHAGCCYSDMWCAVTSMWVLFLSCVCYTLIEIYIISIIENISGNIRCIFLACSLFFCHSVYFTNWNKVVIRYCFFCRPWFPLQFFLIWFF